MFILSACTFWILSTWEFWFFIRTISYKVLVVRSTRFIPPVKGPFKRLNQHRLKWTWAKVKQVADRWANSLLFIFGRPIENWPVRRFAMHYGVINGSDCQWLRNRPSASLQFWIVWILNLSGSFSRGPLLEANIDQDKRRPFRGQINS